MCLTSRAIMLVALISLATLHGRAEILVDFTQGDAISTYVMNPEMIRLENVQGRMLPALEISRDAYSENAWEIKLPGLEGLRGTSIVLEIHFLDAGAGVIQPTLVWPMAARRTVAPGKQCSYTRCNTETERFASFSFSLPAEVADGVPVLRVTGLQYPTRIEVKAEQGTAYWDSVAAARPVTVKPLVTLQEPMRLVTTTGIDVVGGMDTLDASLESIAEIAPLAKALGMTSIEGYVTWKRLEPNVEGVFDFTFYDAIVNKLAEYDLQFFPLLIVGSGYALPQWFLESEENKGFVCLEHGIENAVQSIWSPTHRRHVERVLKAFGEHYGSMGVLEAVRLGPSGNYGESQYPAGGNWGPKGEAMHIHIGWWAGDEFAQVDYRRFLRERYANVGALNTAWGTSLSGFEAITCVLPETMLSPQERADFTQWYTDSMSDWCAWWGGVTREALPEAPIYQSAGGWGFREAGTDYSAQAKGMVPIGGGIRLTNETDSFEQNFYATRLAATAARYYGVPLGYEPASGHTARGVAGRIFNTLTTNGNHLFTYHSNLIYSAYAIDQWVRYVPLFDTRRPPLIDVGIYYPETDNQLGDSAFRYLYAWGFNPRAAAVRRVVDVDYLDDNLIREGYLDRVKVLVWVWGSTAEQDVQERIDAWVRAGGVLIYPSFPRDSLRNVAGDVTVFNRWRSGDTGEGQFHRFRGDMEPPSLYADFVRKVLLETAGLDPWTRAAISAERPERVFLSVQDDGHLVVLNYRDDPAEVVVEDALRITVPPYGIAREAMAAP